MGSILLFLGVLAVIGAWWLSKQGLTVETVVGDRSRGRFSGDG